MVGTGPGRRGASAFGPPRGGSAESPPATPPSTPTLPLLGTRPLPSAFSSDEERTPEGPAPPPLPSAGCGLGQLGGVVVREEGPWRRPQRPCGAPFLAAGPPAWGRLPVSSQSSASGAGRVLPPPAGLPCARPSVCRSRGSVASGLVLSPEPAAGLPPGVRGGPPTPVALSRAPVRGLGCHRHRHRVPGSAARVGRMGGTLSAAGWSGSGPGSSTRPSASWRAPR